MKKISIPNNFDLLRLFAALQVFFNHVTEKLHISVDGLNPQFVFFVEQFPGVPIFYLISGFLIFKSFLQTDSHKTFFIKRALRIYPALWVSGLIANIMLYATGSFALSDMFSFSFIFFNVFFMVTGSWWYPGFLLGVFLNGYPYHFPTAWGGYPNGPTWTITVELGFYILTSLLLIKSKRNNLFNLRKSYFLLLIATVASLFLMMVLTHLTLNPETYSSAQRSILLYSPFPHLWIFILGGLFYLNWEYVSRWVEGKFFVWLPLYYLAAQYNSIYLKSYILDYQTINLSIFIRIILLAFCVFSFAFSFKKSSKILKGVDISYGVYIYHYLVIHAFIYCNWMSSALSGLMAFLITISMAILSWFYIEKPMLKLKNSHSHSVAAETHHSPALVPEGS